MGNTFFFDFEPALIIAIQSHLGTLGKYLCILLTFFGEGTFLIFIMGIMYWGVNKKLGKQAGLVLFSATVWNPMIKNIFLRRRPYMDHAGIQLLKKVEESADAGDIAAQGYSFPSGHSTSSVAIYGTILMNAKKHWLRVICILAPLLIGFSRVALGVHYPTDVLCGWLLGLASIYFVLLMQKYVKNKALLYLIFTLISIPGFFYCSSDDFYTCAGMMYALFLTDFFETRYVNFNNTTEPLKVALRVILGVLIFVGLNAFFKLPFSSEFLENGSLAAHLVRTFRYLIVVFIDLSLYPMLFKKIPVLR